MTAVSRSTYSQCIFPFVSFLINTFVNIRFLQLTAFCNSWILVGKSDFQFLMVWPMTAIIVAFYQCLSKIAFNICSLKRILIFVNSKFREYWLSVCLSIYYEVNKPILILERVFRFSFYHKSKKKFCVLNLIIFFHFSAYMKVLSFKSNLFSFYID